MNETRVALFAPACDPRDPRCFLQLPGLPPTAIAGSLTLKPGARILVEHEDRPVGYLRELFRMPWVDHRVWHAALVGLDNDEWPRNQPVSINLTPVREANLSDGRRIVERALVTELSITSKPAIAGARLLPPSPRTSSGRRASCPSPQAPRTLIRRNTGTILRLY